MTEKSVKLLFMNIKRILCFIVLWFSTGILAAEENKFTVYIAQEEWHTGIILKVDQLPEKIFPEVSNYAGYNYVDIGWGDRDYYMSNRNTVSLALNALLHPTPSVLLVLPYRNHPRNIYGEHSNVIRLELNEHQFYDLCHFMADSFIRDENGYPVSTDVPNFYLSKRKYHLFRTCNTWVAMALKRAGLKVKTFPVIMEWQLFAQLDKLQNAEYVLE
jgi:uncharacterized protein (TIGR02117 family)